MVVNELFTDETTIEDDVPTLTKDQENDTEEILQLFSTNQDEMVHKNRNILIQ
jgi:hypothetical protein